MANLQNPTGKQLDLFLDVPQDVEIWKDIPEWKGYYQASNKGRIKSLERIINQLNCNRIQREGIRKLIKSKKGYLGVILMKKDFRRYYFVHQLVALTFLANPFNLPQVNHINGIKTDNRVENLEWITNLDNMRHAFKMKLFPIKQGETVSNSKLKEADAISILKESKQGQSAKELSIKYKVHITTIYYLLKGTTWKHLHIKENI